MQGLQIYELNICSNNRTISLAKRQAFADCCELPQVWRKCFPKQSRNANIYGKMFTFIILIMIISIGRCYAKILILIYIDIDIDIIEKLLEKDPALQQRTSMTIRQIISLLEFCLRSTYFTFQNKYFEQVEGTAMGSPISPIVANLYMEDLETKAIQTAPHPPVFWKMFVDDTFVIFKASHKQEFLDHINSIDHYMQFTSEESREDGSMPFLGMLIIPQLWKMVVSKPQSIGNLPTQICIYSGTVNIQYLPSIV